MNAPVGDATSTESPGRTSLTSHSENRPPGTSRTPTRGAVPTAEQIEYDRRSSRPSTDRRRVRDWPARKSNSEASSDGTSKVTATASSQSRSTPATRKVWNAVRREIAVDRQEAILADLVEFASIPSVSTDPAHTADIAAAYHAFVVRPTGVIESRFGHSCYRLDVSGRIDAGSSWQLGVLAAHALHAEGRLAGEKDTAAGVLWATGSVRPVDLTVGAVNHVREKLESFAQAEGLQL